MAKNEISIKELDGILRIPDTPSNEENIKTWTRDMVALLLSLTWKDQKPN